MVETGIVPDDAGEPVEAFDFSSHRRQAIEAYQGREHLYADFARASFSILSTCIERAGIKVHSIEHRAKSIESLGEKAQTPSEDDPNRPKYDTPIDQITDLAGVRVITYFLSSKSRIDEIIGTEFDVVERTDKTEMLRQEERLGYHSVHYLVRLRPNRHRLPEYRRFAGLLAEVQVRTVLQHAWAEIEHDIQYKASTALPREIRRRFMTLAGLLEIADREFQAIQDDSHRLQEAARASVAAGRYIDIEITPDALKAFLDRRLGPDGRVASWSYGWAARLLGRLGFSDLQQLDLALTGYDDDRVSRVVHGNRQGQLTRLEDLLLASMGEVFIERHPWVKEGEWFESSSRQRLDALRAGGVPVGSFKPEALAASNAT